MGRKNKNKSKGGTAPSTPTVAQPKEVPAPTPVPTPKTAPTSTEATPQTQSQSMLEPPVDTTAVAASRSTDSSTPLDLKEAINMGPGSQQDATAKKSSESNREVLSGGETNEERRPVTTDVPTKDAKENNPPAPVTSSSTQIPAAKAVEIPKPPVNIHTDNAHIQPPEPSHQSGLRKNEGGLFGEESTSRPATSRGTSSKRPAPLAAASNIKEQAKNFVSDVGRRASHRGEGDKEKGKGDSAFKSMWKSFAGLFSKSS